MKKITLLFLLIIGNQLFAQDSESWNPNFDPTGLSITLGVNSIENNSQNEPFVDVFNMPNRVPFSNPIAGHIEARISNDFSVVTGFAFNKWKAGVDLINSNRAQEDINYVSFGYGVRYYFDNLFLNTKRLEIFAETGINHFRTNSGASAAKIGSGINYWLNNDIAVNLQLDARLVLDKTPSNYNSNHFTYFAGLSYKFKVDTDKDGVVDSMDKCPLIKGLESLNGCPDADSDGIADNDDACPNSPGDIANGGCPDSDNDGVIDRDDACPTVAGSKEFNGCPDSDGDGIIDEKDACANVAGPAANNGCPWPDRDNDGVYDKDDQCPDEPGVASNNGCPELPTGLIEFVNSDKSTILFRIESATLSDEGKPALDELVGLMQQYPKASLIIEGHASSDGSATYNQTLSENRSSSVAKYLTDAGIDAIRLSTVGYGEDRPVEDNATSKGRKANRRVKILRQE